MAVKASFTAMCEDPLPLDVDLCKQVQISELTADWLILNVPTKLSADDKSEAEAICTRFAISAALGYRTVGILDSAGGNLYAC